MTEESPKVGFRAPNFRLKNLRGQEDSLTAHSGKVVFVNFWATWCTPCKAEMPSMEALYHDFKDQGFEILAISSDIEGQSVVDPFVKDYELSYPVLLDPDFYLADKYLIRSVPTTVLVDQNGIITHKIVGARDWNSPESRDLIKRLLRSQ